MTLVLGIMGAMGVAYAASLKTPAEIASGVTGKAISEVTTERNNGKTYGTIAKEAGKLDEFKLQMLENKKAMLDQRVKDGRLTQDRADEIYNNIKTNQSICDGTGSGRKGGCGGQGAGGCGMGRGQGFGRGR